MGLRTNTNAIIRMEDLFEHPPSVRSFSSSFEASRGSVGPPHSYDLSSGMQDKSSPPCTLLAVPPISAVVCLSSFLKHDEPLDHVAHQHPPRAALSEQGAAHDTPARTAGSGSSVRALWISWTHVHSALSTTTPGGSTQRTQYARPTASRRRSMQ